MRSDIFKYSAAATLFTAASVGMLLTGSRFTGQVGQDKPGDKPRDVEIVICDKLTRLEVVPFPPLNQPDRVEPALAATPRPDDGGA